MKSKSLLLLLTLAAALCLTLAYAAKSGASKAETAPPKKVPSTTDHTTRATAASATVSAQLGRFYFPIKDITRQWEWQAAQHMELEYKWSVTLRLKDETYQVGFSRFCFRPKGKNVGTFEQLIASGQVNIWKVNADNTASQEQSLKGVTAKQQGDGLLIQLTEPKLLAQLLAQKPATVGFESIYGSYLPPSHEEDVRVDYE